MTRKKLTSEFKAKVAIEALKGHKMIAKLSSEFGAHSTQINSWKKQLIDSDLPVSVCNFNIRILTRRSL